MTRAFRVLGQLQHHFHGTYWATLVLAAEGMGRQLEEHLGDLLKPFGVRAFHLPSGLVLRGDADQLQPVLDWLEPRRCEDLCNFYDCKGTAGKRHPIDSTAHSIDHGPAFEIELPFLDLLTPLLPFRKETVT